jgi:putative ABC transport system ATP-binding protein
LEELYVEILRTENLCKSYGSRDTRVDALKNATLSVNKGEFIAVVGPSGSGKSTLLHLIGGVDKPTSGKVFVDDIDIYNLNEKQLAIFRRRKVGFVFQFYNLVPVLTTEENILLPILLDNKKPDKAYINELLDLLGLQDRKNHLPSELSGGQQQRVSIGRALAYKPSIILADEPTGNLDSKNSKEIIDLLKISVKRYNQTLMVITHDVDIASQADRVITIEDGIVSKDEVMAL